MSDPRPPDEPGQQSRWPTSFSPPPEPSTRWADDPAADDPASVDTDAYGSGGWQPPTTLPVAPVAPARVRQERSPSLASLVVVALLSAILASGGTFLALRAGGVINEPVASSGPGAIGQPASQRSPSATGAPGVVRIDEQSAITAAAERTGPAIVTVRVRGVTEGDVFGNQLVQGVGSGIIYDSDGWILTNRHVVAGADRVDVELQDGRVFEDQKVYGIDTLTDLAIVKIDGTDLPVAPIGDSSTLKAGQLAIAIGSPLGEFTNTVTSGVVSALGRDIQVADEQTGQPRQLRNLIQTDAAINPGNSGGALLDSGGNVVGVNTAVAGRAQGIGFAIPINIAKPIMQQALAGEELARPWIGIYYEVIDKQLAKDEDLPIDYGALVRRADNEPPVVPDSPAADAGLREGDIVTSVEGQRVDGAHALDDILSQYKPGDEVGMEVLRDGRTLQVTVTLGTRPDLE
jgi:S1-C subfamily serine protease